MVIDFKPTAAVKTIRSNTTTAIHLFMTFPLEGRYYPVERVRAVECRAKNKVQCVCLKGTHMPFVLGLSTPVRASPNCRELN